MKRTQKVAFTFEADMEIRKQKKKTQKIHEIKLKLKRITIKYQKVYIYKIIKTTITIVETSPTMDNSA